MSDDTGRSLDVRRGLQDFMDRHAALEEALEASRARVVELDKNMEEATAQGLKDLETIESLRSALSKAEQKAASRVEASDVVEIRRRLDEAETALRSLHHQIEEFERVSVDVRRDFEELQQRNAVLESELAESRRQLVLDRRAVFTEARERLDVLLREHSEQLKLLCLPERDAPAISHRVEPALMPPVDIDALRQAIEERKARGVALQESIDQMSLRLAQVVEQQRLDAFDGKLMVLGEQEEKIRNWIRQATDVRKRVREEMVGLQGFVSAWELVQGPVPAIQEIPAVPVFLEENRQIESSLDKDGQNTRRLSVVSKTGLIEDLAPKLGLSIEMTTVLALFAVIQKHSNPPHLSLDRILREAEEAELITLEITRVAFIERVKRDGAYTEYFEDILVGRERRNPSVRLKQLLRQSLEGENLPVFFKDEEIRRFIKIHADTR